MDTPQTLSGIEQVLQDIDPQILVLMKEAEIHQSLPFFDFCVQLFIKEDQRKAINALSAAPLTPEQLEYCLNHLPEPDPEVKIDIEPFIQLITGGTSIRVEPSEQFKAMYIQILKVLLRLKDTDTIKQALNAILAEMQNASDFMYAASLLVDKELFAIYKELRPYLIEDEVLFQAWESLYIIYIEASNMLRTALPEDES